MKIGAMFGDVLESLVKSPATERYPYERHDAPARLRGKLLWHRETCTGCQLCVKDCPADAIEVITIDRKAKRFVMRYHVDRCTFCGQCVSSCRQNCITLTSDSWELAALDRDAFTLDYGDDADVQAFLEGRIEQPPKRGGK